MEHTGQAESAALASHRRTIALSLLRTAALAFAVVFVYYVAPLDRVLDTGSWIRFALALLVMCAVIPWQVRAILASKAPWLRALNTVGVGLPLLLVFFAAAYVVIADNVSDAFTEPLSRTDGLYFTLTVFATVGFGDISPKAEIARIMVMIQMVVGLVAVGVIAKVLFGAARVSVEQRKQQAGD